MELTEEQREFIIAIIDERAWWKVKSESNWRGPITDFGEIGDFISDWDKDDHYIGEEPPIDKPEPKEGEWWICERTFGGFDDTAISFHLCCYVFHNGGLRQNEIGCIIESAKPVERLYRKGEL